MCSNHAFLATSTRMRSHPHAVFAPLFQVMHADSYAFAPLQPEAAERFLIVHGQVFLNQFKTYPVKAVREAAFVGALRTRMQQRRHSKLYMAAKRKLRGGLNRNPMRDRAAGRQKPMTATATAMVKGIWASYFAVGSPGARDLPSTYLARAE